MTTKGSILQPTAQNRAVICIKVKPANYRENADITQMFFYMLKKVYKDSFLLHISSFLKKFV